MQKIIEYAIASRTTHKVIPRKFKTAEEADLYIEERVCPKHWKRVEREVTYGDWTDSK